MIKGIYYTMMMIIGAYFALAFLLATGGTYEPWVDYDPTED